MKVQQQKSRSAAPSAASALTLERTYAGFDQINGEHSFKNAVPDGVVEYQVRTRHGGRVVFFNFPLAREMGLIGQDHPDVLTEKLERKLLETFSLVIINEYDIHHRIKFPEKDIRPNRYMATRYLQLQHKDKRGKSSGDGRGIWNGEYKGRGGKIWDVTSSGTGATCLSPAASESGRFFRTGDKRVGYGNGYNTLDEGMSAALMSEIFHQNGVGTERTLVIIGGFTGDEKGTSINVRAGQNLLRPSHLFCHLKQGRLESLKAAVDYHYDRQSQNSGWPKSLRGERRYRFLADEVAKTFARLAATLESEYIFCWLDWDGDNILANGGIIDYGSVRQFGLYYGEYRYDDVERYSTRLPEQRHKARYIVQCFAQIRDFLIYGRKRSIRRFKNDPILKIYDQEMERTYLDAMLERVGFGSDDRSRLLESHSGLVRDFRRVHNYFERVQSKKGVYNLPDGQNRDAVFCMRDLLRQYPLEYTKRGRLSSEDFIQLMAARSAKPEDLKLTEFRARRVSEFQNLYAALISAVVSDKGQRFEQRLLLELGMRSSVINRQDRITGDSAILVTDHFIRWHTRLRSRTLHDAFRAIVDHQLFRPAAPEASAEKQGSRTGSLKRVSRSKAGELLTRSLRLIRKYSESV